MAKIALWVSGGSVGQASIRLARVELVGAFSSPTDPDSAPPCPVMGLFPQGNTPGAEPLSSTWPVCITSYPAANPCKTGVFHARAKWLAPLCETTRPGVLTVCLTMSAHYIDSTHRQVTIRWSRIAAKCRTGTSRIRRRNVGILP